MLVCYCNLSGIKYKKVMPVRSLIPGMGEGEEPGPPRTLSPLPGLLTPSLSQELTCPGVSRKSPQSSPAGTVGLPELPLPLLGPFPLGGHLRQFPLLLGEGPKPASLMAPDWMSLDPKT